MEPMGIERHRRSPKGERAGASESIEAQTHTPSQRVSNSRHHAKRSRRESNPHLRFRKPLFYPLNYGNNDVFDCRFSIADCNSTGVRIVRGGLMTEIMLRVGIVT